MSTQRTFNLRLWFVLTTFVAISIICVLAAFAIAQFMTKALIEREAELSQEFLESLMFSDRQTIFNLPAGSSNPALLEFVNHLFGLPGIIRVNVYSSDRTVLWSTDKRIVGQRSNGNDELEAALDGKRITEVGWLSDSTKPEHRLIAERYTGRYIESYIPIRSKEAQPQIIGVVELYKLPVALNATIKAGQQIIWAGAAVAAAILFAALYWIVQRGAHLIEAQQKELSLMEAMAAIGQMASAVAHSLRNPMATIRSSAELWQAENDNTHNPTVRDIIDQIDRMDKHVRNLLNYSRSDSYGLRPVDPIEVVTSHLPSFSKPNGTVKIEFRLTDLRKQKEFVLANDLLLGQALTSIFTNAVEAMPNGGTLSVSVFNKDQEHVSIEVTDSGGGIPADHIAKVKDSNYTTKTHGFGLGLMLAQRIVERFSGSLDIKSAYGSGTSVSITLKAAP